MTRRLASALAMAWLLAAPTAFASYHTFQIEQLYSNADGTVQFIVLHESLGANGESFWTGKRLTSTHGALTRFYTFANDLPGGSEDLYGMRPSPTANRRVLVATPGFAALGLVTPDYTIPNGFLATDGGTLNYAGVDSVTYTALPTDGVNALNRSQAPVPNLATNFAGQTASVTAAPIIPVPGVWYDPDQSGNGYGMDYKNGVLLVQIYSYLVNGTVQWYLSAGNLTNNVFHGTLDRYSGGQCASGPACTLYKDPGPPVGNDGEIVITFTSARSANVVFPGGRQSTIQPYFPP